MVNDELRFTEILEDIKFSARSNGGFIKEEDVREAFEELDLSKEQFSMVFDYLKKNNIGIGEPLSEDEYLGSEERDILKEYDRELGALVKKQDLTKDEIKARLKMNRCANLINEYGGRAAMVLAARGVGPDTASRILRSMYVDEDGFLRSILTAEVAYAKNKQFWD